MPKSRLSAGLYLLMVFLSGILVGGFSYRVYTMNSVNANAPKRNPEEYRRRWMQDFRTEVKVDDQQVAQVQQILDDTRRQFDEAHKRTQDEARKLQNAMVDRIRAVLREDQRPLYDKFRAEREKMRHRGDKGGGRGPEQK